MTCAYDEGYEAGTAYLAMLRRREGTAAEGRDEIEADLRAIREHLRGRGDATLGPVPFGRNSGRRQATVVTKRRAQRAED